MNNFELLRAVTRLPLVTLTVLAFGGPAVGCGDPGSAPTADAGPGNAGDDLADAADAPHNDAPDADAPDGDAAADAAPDDGTDAAAVGDADAGDVVSPADGPCARDSQCEQGLICVPDSQTGGGNTALRCAPGCRIHGIAYAPGAVAAAPNNCQSCQPNVNTNGWTVVAAATVCRPSAGGCDVVELCDGTGMACPAEAVLPMNTLCGGGLCDGANAACCSGTCAPGECGLFDDGCGGQKDCGACFGTAPGPSRRCAPGLTADASGVCKEPLRSECALSPECASGYCNCASGKVYDPVIDDFPCGVGGGYCTGRAGAACAVDDECASALGLTCIAGTCRVATRTTKPLGAACTLPTSLQIRETRFCYVSTDQRRSTECDSGWCLRITLDRPTTERPNGSPVCCRELTEECSDDRDCCAGTFCNDNTVNPLRIRRCMADAEGIKRCAKVSLVGEPCLERANCYGAADLDCIAGVCTSTAAPPPLQKGAVCSLDNGTTKLACDAGLVCANCTGAGNGYRCIPDGQLGCCSTGRDVLDDCGDGLWGQCCNWTCVALDFDKRNCGNCGHDCSKIDERFVGGDACWNAQDRCLEGVCQYDSACASGNCLVTGSIGTQPITACYQPVFVEDSLFTLAASLGQSVNLTADTSRQGCYENGDCPQGERCQRNCRNGQFGGLMLQICNDPGVCIR